jgi:HTH domain
MNRRGWAYTGALLGGAVSIAANVAHSYVPPTGAAPGWRPHTGAVLGAVFWPVALFVAIEILARTGWPTGRRWTLVRYLGLLPVALVAAIVSYRHMSGLLAFYGEDLLTVRIGPLAVDGLMVMAVGALLAGARPAVVDDQAAELDLDAGETADPWEYAEPIPEPVTPAAVEQEEPQAVPAPAARTELRWRPKPKASNGRPSTATQIARLAARSPQLSPEEIAAKAGVSTRTVRRHLAALNTGTAEPAAERVNGTPMPDLMTGDPS